MSEQNASTDERPSLRVAELTIENFRTFRERTVIPFSNGEIADAIATFHGDNGSGKSNALAAIEVFFRAVRFLLEVNAESTFIMPWDVPIPIVSRRDRPANMYGPTSITARFADARLGTLTVIARPAGNQLNLEWIGTADAWRERKSGEYKSWVETPFGRDSRAVAVINASRQASWFEDQRRGEALQPALAEALLGARASREPERRARWRDFLDALATVAMFAGKDVSIDRTDVGSIPELTVEERGKSVLGLEELSSGERQLVILFASILLSESAIVAIEEPELSLDAKSQQLFRNFLQDLVQKRRIDQAIIESHVAAFDGPDVIRFHRAPGGPTTVSRAPSESAESAALTKKAREQGAERAWVTRDGYTELPENMRQDLQLMQGGGLWFLKGDRWEAWLDRDVNQMLGGGEAAEPERG